MKGGAEFDRACDYGDRLDCVERVSKLVGEEVDDVELRNGHSVMKGMYKYYK